MPVVVMVITCLVLAVGAKADELKWYSYGPIAQARTEDKAPVGLAPNSEIRRISYAAGQGDYWVGAGVELSKPTYDNQVELYLKASPQNQQRPVTLVVIDSRGHKGYYEFTATPEWKKFSLRREQPRHTDGGALQDIAKVEVILLNTWFKPGETWTLDVAGIKTSEIEVPPYQWYDYSSGQLSVKPAAEKGPEQSGEVRQIKFISSPGDYWVGAGIALARPKDDNVIDFYIRKNTPQDRTVTMKVLDSSGRQGFYELNVPNDWVRVSLRRERPVHTGGGETPRDIAKIEFIMLNRWFAPGEVWSVDVAGLKTSKISPLPYLHPFWMPDKVPPPVPGNRVEMAIHNIFPGGRSTYPGLENPAGLPMAQSITQNFIQQFGPVGIEIGYLKGENGAKFAQFLHQHGALAAVTAHNRAAFDQPENGRQLNEEEKKSLWSRNIQGQIPLETGLDSTHGEDLTNPRFLKLAQQLYLDSAKAGADVYRPVDYVWPFTQGGWTWTFSEAALKRWPEDLKETDVGLELGKGIDPKKPLDRRVAHFWEYFQSYHGYRMKPQDVGIASWDEYRPPTPDAPDSPQKRNNHVLINMLYHYEWVKFANEVVRPSAEQYGMLTQPVCNPEENNNGTDLYWLSKLAFARGYWTEWWGHPGTIIPTYYNGTYYDNAVKTNGKEMVIGGEVAAAGGNPYDERPHYWDNMAGYLVAYSQAGSTSAKAQNHQYWAWTWERALDPKAPEYASYTGMRSSWSGFLQNRNDQAVKPKTTLLALSMRAVVQGMPYFDHGSDQPYNLGQNLVQLNYLHDGAAFPIEDAYKLEDYKTIVMSSFQPPQGFAKRLQQWLGQSAGRTLISHSFVPTRYSAPLTSIPTDPIAYIQAGGQEKLLGFGSINESDVTSGILQARHPIFQAALQEWDGKNVTFSRGICRTSGMVGEKVLVSLNNLPLVSEHRVGQGRVIYLHFFANEASIIRGKLQRAIVNSVMRYCDYNPMAITPPDHSAIMLQKPGGGKVFITLNGAANTVLQDDKARLWNSYQAQDGSVKAVLRLRGGKPRTRYQITDMINGQKQLMVSDSQGYISVSNDGWNMRGLAVEEAKAAGQSVSKP